MLLETLAVKLQGDVSDFVAKMNTAAGAVVAVGDKMQATGQRMQSMGQQWSLYVSAPLIALGKSALDSAADFEQSMNVMQQMSGATGNQMAALSKQALQLGKDTVFGAGEAAQAQLELSKSGFEVTQVMDAMPGILNMAAAANIEVADAAKIAGGAINAFNLDASESTRIADMLAAAANSSAAEVSDMALGFQQSTAAMALYGQTAEGTTTALALLANAGIRGSDAGTSLKVAMMRLAAPTSDDARDMIKKLGIQVYDSSGKMRDLRDILVDFERALGPAATMTEKVGGASKELTKAMVKAREAMGPLSNTMEEQQTKLGILQQELSDTIAKYGEGSTQVANKRLAIEKLNNTMAESQKKYADMQLVLSEYARMQAGVRDVTSEVTDQTRNAALQTIFGTDAIRTISVLLGEGTAGWDKMSEAVNQSGAAQDVANARMKGLSGAIEYFKGTLDSLMIETALPWLNTLGDLIRSTADWIAKFGELDPALQKNIVIIAALAAAIGPVLIYSGLLVSSIGSLVSAFGTLAAFLMANPITALVALTAALVAFAVAWDENWLGVQEKTRAAIDFIQAYVRDNLPGWIAKLQEWGAAAWQWIIEATPQALEKLGEWGAAAYQWVTDHLPEWKARLLEWAKAAYLWVTETAIPILREKLGELGAMMVQWIQENIPILTPWIDEIGRFASNVKDKFALVGEYIMTLASGFAREMPGMGNAVVDLGRTVGTEIPRILGHFNDLWSTLSGGRNGQAIGSFLGKFITTAIKGVGTILTQIRAVMDAFDILVRATGAILSGDFAGYWALKDQWNKAWADFGGATSDQWKQFQSIWENNIQEVPAATGPYLGTQTGGNAAGGVTIQLSQTFTGNVDKNAVASATQQGIMQGLRQVGLA